MPKSAYETGSLLINVPTEAEDAEIVAAALTDTYAHPLTDAQLARMVPLRTLLARKRR